MSLKIRLQDWLGISQLRREQHLEIMLVRKESQQLEMQLKNLLQAQAQAERTLNPSDPNSSQTESEPGPDTFYDPHLGRW